MTVRGYWRCETCTTLWKAHVYEQLSTAVWREVAPDATLADTYSIGLPIGGKPGAYQCPLCGGARFAMLLTETRRVPRVRVE